MCRSSKTLVGIINQPVLQLKERPVPTGRETPGARKVTEPSVFGVTVLLNSSSRASLDTSLLLTKQWVVSMSSNWETFRHGQLSELFISRREQK